MTARRDELINVIAREGWIRSYVQYASARTDAYREYHLACGLTVLSAAIGSRITFCGLGQQPFHPNLYTLIIGPSGKGRKTTSINLATHLLEEADPTLFPPEEFSREKLVQNLAAHPTALFKVPEFSTLLAAMNREYMAGTASFLTDLYDYRDRYERVTLKDQKTVILDPCICILGASTAEWLIEHLKPSDLHGGFMGRFLMVVGRTRGEWRGLSAATSDDSRSELVAWLRTITQMPKATVDFSNVAGVFDAWLKDIEHKHDIESTPAEMTGFVSRIGAHTLKLAVLFEVSAMGPARRYVVTSKSFQSALLMIEGILLPDLVELMETKLVFSRQERAMQSLLDRIGRNGGIDRRALLRSSHLTVNEFDKLIATLVERGEIVTETKRTAGRPATIIRRADSPQAPADDAQPWIRD